jgi:hypothetical protein
MTSYVVILPKASNQGIVLAFCVGSPHLASYVLPCSPADDGRRRRVARAKYWQGPEYQALWHWYGQALVIVLAEVV